MGIMFHTKSHQLAHSLAIHDQLILPLRQSHSWFIREYPIHSFYAAGSFTLSQNSSHSKYETNTPATRPFCTSHSKLLEPIQSYLPGAKSAYIQYNAPFYTSSQVGPSTTKARRSVKTQPPTSISQSTQAKMYNPLKPTSQRTSLASRQNPALSEKIAQMALPLAPLVRITTGQIHPSFPATLLNFWLLTSEQLDDLAHFYHQRTPSVWSAHYPCPVIWGRDLSLEEKRRKIGRFIGLRGCESPVESEEDILRRVRDRGIREEEEEEGVWRRKGRFY
jgi:hypothetical protein